MCAWRARYIEGGREARARGGSPAHPGGDGGDDMLEGGLTTTRASTEVAAGDGEDGLDSPDSLLP
jgi:hypothetical protein